MTHFIGNALGQLTGLYELLNGDRVSASKLPPGKPRTDLSAWPDGSLRWRPYDPSPAKAKRNIDNERSVRRAMRFAVRSQA